MPHVTRTGERGSALAEAALVFPCLVLAISGSVAMAELLILKLKAAEAARFALWESTVFKAPSEIESEVQQRFADLRSPRRIREADTGLWSRPSARSLSWRADVDMTSAEVALGGTAQMPWRGKGWGRFLDALSGPLSRSVDAAAAKMRFNTRGMASARVSLATAGLRFQAPLASQRPLQLVFDTWRAWPKPAAYSRNGASTDVRASPSLTYPEVEKQVSAQAKAIAFFGVSGIPGFHDLNDLVARVFRFGVTQTVVGGTLPDIFSAERMDDMGTNRGPITILPPEQAAESWVPRRCGIAGRLVPCPAHRLGDLTGAGARPLAIDEDSTIGDHVDRSRYTVPYRVHTAYWRRSGGMDRELESRELEAVPERLARENDYVRTYRCRGHFFAGSRRPQVANSFGGCR